MITINNVTYRNLPEQVQKNKEDIAEIQQSIGPGSGTKVYQHLITITDSNEDFTGTFLLISTASTPINSVTSIPVGIVMNSLGIATLDGYESTSTYGIRKEYNGDIKFKGVEIKGGAYNETSWTIWGGAGSDDYTITDEVSEI